MSRRRYHYDPVEQQATDRAAVQYFGQQVEALLHFVTERESELISRLLDGQMLWEAAEAAGLSYIEAEMTLMWTISAYRGGRPVSRNHDLKTDELHRILRLFSQATDRDFAAGKRRWCQFHLGWTESRGNPCGGCPCDLKIARAGGLGRPRRYCDNACRQRAYRRRKADR